MDYIYTLQLHWNWYTLTQVQCVQQYDDNLLSEVEYILYPAASEVVITLWYGWIGSPDCVATYE